MAQIALPPWQTKAPFTQAPGSDSANMPILQLGSKQDCHLYQTQDPGSDNATTQMPTDNIIPYYYCAKHCTQTALPPSTDPGSNYTFSLKVSSLVPEKLLGLSTHQ